MAETNIQSKHLRPPIVTVLGHVDHGKTSLLDFIRNSHVAAGEHGGITQSIGAYSAEVKTSEGLRHITFIDTPGHEAFSKMRSRGAQVADIAILVVSAEDGVMPQTKEAIQHINEAKIPMVVAINKMDLPGANVEKVKRQLSKADVQVEGYGGDVVVVPISAKTGQGVDQLLEMVLLTSDVHKAIKDYGQEFLGVIIESKRDRRRGPVATIIVKAGTIHIGDKIVAETVDGKVKGMVQTGGNAVKISEAGYGVEVLGFNDVPPVGAPVTYGEAQKKSSVTQFKKDEQGEGTNEIKIILKADTVGSLEALRYALPEGIIVLSEGVGEITESDVLFAKTTGSIIIGFNIHALPTASKLAELERVIIKSEPIIYTLVEELTDVIEALKTGGLEEILGEAAIVASFPFNKQQVAGIKVTSGRIAKGDLIKLMRENEEIARGRIGSVREGKTETTKIEAPNECGIGFAQPLDFAPGDAIIAYRK